MDAIAIFSEYGMVGVVAILFSYMVMNIIKSLKTVNEDIDELRQAIHKMEAVIDNSQGIILKLIDRINAKDKAESIRGEKSNESRAKSLERFATRVEYLERLIIRLEGKLEGRWSSGNADRR